jgi:hypothetical protein
VVEELADFADAIHPLRGARRIDFGKIVTAEGVEIAVGSKYLYEKGSQGRPGRRHAGSFSRERDGWQGL